MLLISSVLYDCDCAGGYSQYYVSGWVLMFYIRRIARQQDDENHGDADEGEGGAHGKGDGPEVREDVGRQG